MQGRISEIYLKKNGAASPSGVLEQYLGEYESMLPVIDCAGDDNKDLCDSNLKAYAASGNMIFDNHQLNATGYPTVVLSRGDKAYIIRSTAEFDRLVGCGSLKG
jgi:hypothetical protein